MYRERFFSQNGLTSASANHICNIAKEMYQKEDAFLKDISFVNKYISLISNENSKLIKAQISPEQMELIESSILKVAKLKTLIAYLKEAIKEKEKVLNYYKVNYDIHEYMEENNIKIGLPARAFDATLQDYFNTLNVDQLLKYFRAETYSAVLGAYIHPDGSISKARQEYLKCSNSPFEVEKDGVDSIVTSYDSTLESDTIENLFQKLQNSHREYQKEFNGMKFEKENFISDKNIEIMKQYNTEYKEYNDKMNVIRNEHKIYVQEKIKEISSLKIAIPENLVSLVKEIDLLGKLYK